jgi:uncharacterized protein YciU (UPF0263 family)
MFAVDQEYKADLIYCEVAQDYKAKGDTLWFYVKQENQATCKIFWVQQDYKADVKVFKTNQEYKAKWNKSNKFQNRIG